MLRELLPPNLATEASFLPKDKQNRDREFQGRSNVTRLFILTMKGLDTVESLSVEASGFTKTRAFPTKSGQNISSSVGFTKTRAFAAKSGQNISSL
jgi:hypothetical protein